ncbi:MAG: phenylalanine--tRNA ligase subunit alpha [Phenylobacterium sp.]|jgi:phenylalanyl-tRNA synthetase alpha chain|uniref:phenylalanine--tRNA ligase subunit alpha n=2 Tax=Phenylobacterium sp. TaxID=1871053 RepID=UPI0025E72EA5|nr:phenylalanine--tRNA ligase subunit alpha [Phenylobacterium sp.]MCA3710804.1 phenylalanine--tRNA ligase subunit alpha [Phenylobacterium sp.]MCA3728690.1 phenylalanine--tRNA ligase subunit alpha [Phenylobacterium sp.]MCA3731925.1 phenylalanine--tRNA ligase subunit alpha [Phenylobacterium sp.]MCA3741313.1 phenylalanine--tRNA ligase subunit alpha [Phenylobacterium sp.]MCA3746368.1 phenylalanine--tRNA ligase subunit alpha [Phenylobacterium sp.]
MTDIAELESNNLTRIDGAADLAALDEARVAILGKSGNVTLLARTLGSVSLEERKVLGPQINQMRDRLAARIEARKAELEAAELEAQLAASRVDLSLPAPPRRRGGVHPTMQVMDELVAVFADMGFGVAEGPDIETDFNNFTALNFPPKHPAREMHDTFFLPPDAHGERKVLRTHTSPVQVRVMNRTSEKLPSWIATGQEPPIRVIVPGRTFRQDSDQTHTPMFHQIEGLVIDKGIHMGHLKWTLETFIARFFETDRVTTRFRPHHFPFTEPSAEIDVKCDRSGGEVRIGEGEDWLEILGCGMVHPNVLRNCGLDPDVWQGFAFGCGVDRLGVLKYGMPDLRDMFAADVRWLAHYGFSAFAAPNPASGLS